MSTKQLWLFTSVHVCVSVCVCAYTPKGATRGPKPKGVHWGRITKSCSPQMFVKYHNEAEKMGPELSDCCVDTVLVQFCLTIDEHALDKCASKSLNPCQLVCSTIKCKLDNRRAVSPKQTPHWNSWPASTHVICGEKFIMKQLNRR